MCAYLHKKNYAENVLHCLLKLTFSPFSSPVSLIGTGGRGRGGQGMRSFFLTNTQRDADSGDSE